METARPPSSRTVWSQLDFWNSALSYIVLMVVLELLLRTSWARGIVEQQSGGLLKPVFDNYAGADVTGSVIDYLGGALFWAMIVLGFITSIALWPLHRTIALGVFSGVAILFGLVLLYLLYGELGVHTDYFSRLTARSHPQIAATKRIGRVTANTAQAFQVKRLGFHDLFYNPMMYGTQTLHDPKGTGRGQAREQRAKLPASPFAAVLPARALRA